MQRAAATGENFEALALFAAPVRASAAPFYYPAKDQSAEQLNKDKFECYGWASGQTGFDPAAAPPKADESGVAAAEDARRGSAVRGGARGAERSNSTRGRRR